MQDDWISVDEAGNILRQARRTVYRHGQEERVRTQKVAGRVLFHRGDVETLAEQLGIANMPPPMEPPAVIPPGELLELIERLTGEIASLSMQLGEARGRAQMLQEQIDRQRPLLEDAEELRRSADLLEVRRAALEEELERYRRPWWRRMFND